MLLALVAAMAAATPSADAVVGRWKTETKNAVVDIARCGQQLCGTLMNSDSIRANPAFPDSKNPTPRSVPNRSRARGCCRASRGRATNG